MRIFLNHWIHLDHIEKEMIDVYCNVHDISFKEFIEQAISDKLSPFVEELEEEVTARS